MRDTFTLATFLVHQVKASRTQTLVPDLEVVANVGAASIVIQALVGACGWTERFIPFLDCGHSISRLWCIYKWQSIRNSPHSLRGSSDQSLQSRRWSHTLSMLIHSPLRHLNLVGPSQWVAVTDKWT